MAAEIKNLEQARRTLAAADAHGAHAVLCAAPAHFEQDVTDGNRASIDVESVKWNPELLLAVQRLRSERLVVHLAAMSWILRPVRSKKSRDCQYRAEAHLVGRAAGNGKTPEDTERFEVSALCIFGRHQHEGSGAVRELRGVAGGDAFGPAVLPGPVVPDLRRGRRAGWK